VIFELGLFVGRLSKERSFIIVPRGAEDALHLPTDLLGITPALFDASRQDGNLVAALGPACSKITRALSKLGGLKPAREASEVPADSPKIVYSEGD
jgi:predicted nucleotide-binding protein